MKLSVIITHYKTPNLLRLCLRSVQETCAGIDTEILIGDSEAQDETGEMLADEFPAVRHLAFADNVGYARLVNAGLRESTGEYILILNADIVLVRNAPATLIDFLSAHPRAGMAGPKLFNFNGTHQYSCFRFYQPFTVIARRTILGKTRPGIESIKKFLMVDELAASGAQSLPVDWLMGSALCIKRSAYDAVGGLDEGFFMYFEDVDWCRRFWENNYAVVYVPSATAYHYHQKASNAGRGIFDIALNRQTRIHASSSFRYFRKYWNKPVPPARLETQHPYVTES